jgi:hypothetical protein
MPVRGLRVRRTVQREQQHQSAAQEFEKVTTL